MLMFWQFDCSYIKSQWHVWSKGLLHNCFFQNGVQLDSISMVWHFEISTYEIHSHGKNYQHFKKTANPVLCYIWKENYHYIFNQIHPPYLVSIYFINFIFLQFIHSFIHPSIHPSICSNNFHFWNCTYQPIVLLFILTAKLLAARTKFRKSIIRNALFKPLHGHISHTPGI